MVCKTIQDSRSSISAVVLPAQANSAGNVHGGEIMKMMDVAASVVAMKHTRSNVVTVRVDELIFLKPILVGQFVTCNAEIVYVGRTSMEIEVEVVVENLDEDKPAKVAQTAYFTFVRIGENGCPAEVPRLKLCTKEEESRFEEGKKRYEKHKKIRK